MAGHSDFINQVRTLVVPKSNCVQADLGTTDVSNESHDREWRFPLSVIMDTFGSTRKGWSGRKQIPQTKYPSPDQIALVKLVSGLCSALFR